MLNQKIRVGIVGGAGYTGGELIRILINHPHVDIAFVNSKSNAGNNVAKVHTDLFGETELNFTSELNFDVDVLFLCTGHGEARKFLESVNIPDPVRIIDLSHDFRLHEKSTIGSRKFVYGLPELNRESIKKANNVANPGCFATAIQLGLLPLAKNKLLSEVYTVGITGSTGAGQSLSDTSHFSWRANNIQAYKTLQHQHMGEVSESITKLQQQNNAQIHFVPWRGDFAKGIFITSQLKINSTLEDLHTMFTEYYQDHPFVSVCTSPIALKQVVNTNKALIQLEMVNDNLVIHSIIDNLIKGASGQAVQNMNIIFGVEETSGLKLKATAF